MKTVMCRNCQCCCAGMQWSGIFVDIKTKLLVVLCTLILSMGPHLPVPGQPSLRSERRSRTSKGRAWCRRGQLHLSRFCSCRAPGRTDGIWAHMFGVGVAGDRAEGVEGHSGFLPQQPAWCYWRQLAGGVARAPGLCCWGDERMEEWGNIGNLQGRKH